MKNDASDIEKRKFPRVPGRVAIEVSPLLRPLDAVLGKLASATDLSGGGLCFVGPEEYPPGTRLSLRLRLPGIRALAGAAPEPPRSIRAIAEAVWSRPDPEGQGFSVGIRFLDIYEADYRALTSFLKSLS